MIRTSLEGDELKWKLRDTMGGSPRADTGKYKGRLWKTEQTLAKRVLGETEFARCDVHSVVSADHKSIINDWIFLVRPRPCKIDRRAKSTNVLLMSNTDNHLTPQEERDHVNIVVYTKEKKFLVFQQRKYAIPGETKSLVGGFIDDGETPFDAARREVVEELGVGSENTIKLLKKSGDKRASKEAKDNGFDIPSGQIVFDEFGLADGKVPADEPQWTFLGRYRVQASRGGGFLYSYLLMDAVPVIETGGTAEYMRTGDIEQQTLVTMSKDEVATALAIGEFQEVQWTASLSLSLLHMQKQEIKAQ